MEFLICRLKTEGGHPEGTTLLMNRHLKESILVANNEITSLYHMKKKESNKKGETIPGGSLKQIIETDYMEMRLLSHINIPMITIQD